MPDSTTFLRDGRGSIAVMTALTMVVICIVAAFAVDLGMLYHQRRQLQGAVDLAAIAAANDIDRAKAAAVATLAANGVTGYESISVELGSYSADPAIPPAKRFAANEPPFNAARVALKQRGRLNFARAFTTQSIDVGVVGTAATRSLANFSIGSRLLAVRGGIANAVLGKLLGSNVSLSIMDYNALVSADIQLLSFMNALATQVHITGGTYSQVLDSSATAGDVLTAAATVASANGNTSAANILLGFAHSTTIAGHVPLNSIIDLGPYADLAVGDMSPGTGASMSAMDLLNGVAVIANGKHQVQVDLAGQVPGLLALTADISIGEPMKNSGWVSVGESGSKISTAQTRVRLIAKVGGTGLLAGVTIELPIYLELAYASGRLAAVTCSDANAATVTIGAQPGIAQLWIGATPNDLTDWSVEPAVTSAALLATPLLSVSAKSYTDIGNQNEIPLTFDQNDINAMTLKRAETSDYAQSLVSTLLGDMQLQVNVSGLHLGLTQPAITQALASQLGTIAAPLDDVIHSTLDTLGVHLGEVDVVVRGASCSPGVLTN